MSYNGSIRKHKVAIMEYSVHCSGYEFESLPELDRLVLLSSISPSICGQVTAETLLELTSIGLNYVLAGLLEAAREEGSLSGFQESQISYDL